MILECRNLSLRAEANVVGCLYLNSELFIENKLTPEDFTFNHWRVYFIIASDLFKENKSLTEDNIEFYLNQHPQLAEQYRNHKGYETIERLVDIVKEEDRQSGIFAIIPPDTEITNIGGAVNDSIMESPLQFFINEGLISFKTGEGESEKDMGETLDLLSSSDDEKKYIYYTDEDFAESEKYYESVWVATTDSEGIACYTVSKWRTQPLSLSFAYIINLMTKFPSINIPR